MQAITISVSDIGVTYDCSSYWNYENRAPTSTLAPQSLSPPQRFQYKHIQFVSKKKVARNCKIRKEKNLFKNSLEYKTFTKTFSGIKMYKRDNFYKQSEMVAAIV